MSCTEMKIILYKLLVTHKFFADVSDYLFVFCKMNRTFANETEKNNLALHKLAQYNKACQVILMSLKSTTTLLQAYCCSLTSY